MWDCEHSAALCFRGRLQRSRQSLPIDALFFLNGCKCPLHVPGLRLVFGVCAGLLRRRKNSSVAEPRVELCDCARLAVHRFRRPADTQRRNGLREYGRHMCCIRISWAKSRFAVLHPRFVGYISFSCATSAFRGLDLVFVRCIRVSWTPFRFPALHPHFMHCKRVCYAATETQP